MTKAWQGCDAVHPYRRAYLGWHGLAWAGATIAYQPFLSFLLPLKIIGIGGHPDPILLSKAVLLGGVTAGFANLGWGLVGDRVVARGGGRRWLILAGLVGVLLSYVMLALASTPTGLLLALFGFQLVLNLLLSALVATAADEVPVHDKGLLGGVLCIGAPAGALVSVVTTLPGMSVERGLLWIAAMITILVLPYALQQRYPVQRGPQQSPTTVGEPAEAQSFMLLWLVRLLLQIASKAVFFFLIYYFAETVGQVLPAAIAQLTLIAALIAPPAALFLGRVSDQYGCHRVVLLAMIAVMASGLVIMAIQSDLVSAVLGYLVFASSAAISLSLHSGYSMLRLPVGLASGKGLGLLNLANTLPAVAVAALGTAIVPQHGYRTLCWILAGAVVVAGSFLIPRKP
ncbi:hypothetical protein [Sphingomonas sp. TWP1-3-1]|uniref:hypothetical protein n=1 Tax=Sphingomonas sp. TWP1-3-1 TaxID=2804612 RepID=UPI003CF6A59B